jgi:hypothetical protein
MSINSSNKCKALIQQGERVGLQCQRVMTENGFCIHHQRNYTYELLIKQGNILCSMFFRGCNNELSKDDIDNSYKNCRDCRVKKSGKLFKCQYEDCTFKIKNESDKYCKKHIRQHLYDIESSSNIKYCDISRGCFNKIESGIKCEECKLKERAEISKDIELLRIKHNIPHILSSKNEVLNELSLKQEKDIISVSELWRSVQRGAYIRELLFTITESDFEKLAIQPCYYCGFYSNTRLNGIDRIDNNKGYIHENCITSCKMCNIIKNTQHPIEFLDKIDSIVDYLIRKTNISDKLIINWLSYLTKRYNGTYKDYTYRTKMRNMEMILTEKEYYEILKGDCYLCGIKNNDNHQNGIDRIDNSIRAYTIENSKTCCGHCNLMKGIYEYDDFINKCIQINAYKCDKSIFNSVPKYDNTKCRNEYYTADDIFKFMTEGRYIQFLEWCKEKDKTPEFINTMNIICNSDSSLIDNKESIISEIQKELEKERRRHSNGDIESKKNIQCTTIYAYLISGKKDVFTDWYNTNYTATSLFNEKLEELIKLLPALDKDSGIKACQKFMYDEKNRRNTQLRRESSKKTTKYSNKNISNNVSSVQIIKKTSSPLVSSLKKRPSIATDIELILNICHETVKDDNMTISNTQNTIIIPNDINQIEEKIKIIQNSIGYEKKEIVELKQWKSRQIYEAIIENNENTYKEFCETHNDLSKVPTWEIDWAEFILSIKGRTYEESEERIQNFIENLRRIRHNTLCYKKNSKLLEKDERQQWPASTVVRAFLEGKIDRFKEFTENATGDAPDNPKWKKRWDAFIETLEANRANPTQLKVLCSKFMTSQRAKKYRRSS